MKGLIDYLNFAYTYLHKGRGILKAEDIRAIQWGAGTVARTAPEVLGSEDAPQGEELRLAAKEARMISQHIDDYTDWLLRLEM